MYLNTSLRSRSYASSGILALAFGFGVVAFAPAVAAEQESVSEAQAAEVLSGDAAAEDANVGEIIVTARRVAENLQDVPQQVTALSGSDLSKLAITQFENVAALVPALTLGRDGYGFTAPSIRGVPQDNFASQAGTVDIYLNEIPLDSQQAFAGLFDISNIQVLEGPQGTARGRTAPSGAILLTTRRPNVDRIGGYVSGLAAEYGEYNIQGGVNVPIIPGKLAVRVAGLYNEGPAFIRSVNSPIDGRRVDKGGRITALFTPSDSFDVLLTYQHFNQTARSYGQVFGAGSPGGTYGVGGVQVPNPFAAPGYNGPPISPFDRLAVGQSPTVNSFKYDFLSAQVNAQIAGHRITYLGSYNNGTGQRKVELDPGNMYAGGLYQEGPYPTKRITQEVRIASEAGGFFDYTFGYYFSRDTSNSLVSLPGGFLDGAFGADEPFNPTTVDPRYILQLDTTAPIKRVEHSIFASVTLRPGPATEITLGGRQLFLDNDIYISYSNRSARSIALRSPCPAGVPGLVPSFYSGYCDAIVEPRLLTEFNSRLKRKPFVYSASISHRFTDDFMVYGNVASSFRMPFPSAAIRNGLNDPLLNQLQFPNPEKSTSFEIGLKSNWLDNRLRVNATVFYQKFDGLLFTTIDTPYREVTAVSPLTQRVNTAAFGVNGDTTVKGFNVDVSFQPTRNFSIGGAVSYSKARLNNQLIPCRDANFDGVPDGGTPTIADFEANGVFVAQCRTSEVVSRSPMWRATIQSEFTQPVNSQMDAYVRGLLTYFSPNFSGSQNFTADAHALLTLYAGVRSPNGAWDLGVFVRNATNARVELTRGVDDLSVGDPTPFGLSGYRRTSVTEPRQFGLSLRYAFGSR